MAIREWTEEYASGMEHIDEQHRQLFHWINTFEEMNKRQSINKAAEFLESMMEVLIVHFQDEEAVMAEIGFPLIDVHKAIHSAMLEDLQICMESLQHDRRSKGDSRFFSQEADKDMETFKQILEIAANWLHHVARDDKIIFHYHRHKNFNLANAIFGRSCEIMSLDNKLLGYGRVDLVSDKDIEINYRHGPIPVAFNDVVKVSVIMENQETCQFVSKVYLNKASSVKLFRGAVINTGNERAFYRISVLIDAMLRPFGFEPVSMMILDISAGGMLVETEAVLQPSEEVIVEFMLEKIWFSEKCIVTRAFKKDTRLSQYGMKFEFVDPESLSNITGQLNYLQMQRNMRL